MSYGDTLLTNGDAETGDTTGWSVVNVTVEGDTTPAVDLQPQFIIGDDVELDNWLEEDYTPQLVYTGSTGKYYFMLASDASMEQTIMASDLGELPDEDFKITIDYKIPTAQELYDAVVRGWVEVEVLYTDESKDIHAIPCIAGLDMEGRLQTNDWIRVSTIIALRDTEDEIEVTSITITAKTVAFSGGLKIDQILFQKNLEVNTDIDEGEEGQVLGADEDGKPKWKYPPPTFVFTITGSLTVDDDSCPALPVPYACAVDKVYAYVKTAPEKVAAGGDAIIIDIKKDGTTMFPDMYAPERAKIQHGEQTAESDTPYSGVGYTPNLTKNEVLTMVPIQVGDSVAGADLTVEVRCK